MMSVESGRSGLKSCRLNDDDGQRKRERVKLEDIGGKNLKAQKGNKKREIVVMNLLFKVVAR